jgi:hypothetical protein
MGMVLIVEHVSSYLILCDAHNGFTIPCHDKMANVEKCGAVNKVGESEPSNTVTAVPLMG